ncbi:18757_t:CDS:2, partial [Acaulospora morrowiae]
MSLVYFFRGEEPQVSRRRIARINSSFGVPVGYDCTGNNYNKQKVRMAWTCTKKTAWKREMRQRRADIAKREVRDVIIRMICIAQNLTENSPPSIISKT